MDVPSGGTPEARRNLGIRMGAWRSVDGLPDAIDEGRDLPREVPVLPIGPIDGQEGPEELVRLVAPHRALMGEEHEVHPGVRVELQEAPDVLPHIEGIGVGPCLHDGPEGREDVPDGHLVGPLEVLCIRMADVLFCAL